MSDDDLDLAANADGAVAAEIDAVTVEASGALWSLPHGGDLDANLVRVLVGDSIGEHVNDEVDVLIVVWDGDGQIAVDEVTSPLRRGVVVSVPKGASRAIRSGSENLTYLSIHRRRDGLTIRPSA